MLASLSEAAKVVTRNTPMGWLAVVTKDDTLWGVTFAHPSPQAALRNLPTADSTAERSRTEQDTTEPLGLNVTSRATPLVRRLEKFLAGKPDDLLDVKINEAWCTPFQLAVIRAVREIPLGETRTYGQVAELAGSPRAARAVGSIMAQNRTPLVVPCHRVVASGGMGGFSARGGLRTKLRLLETEAKAKGGGRSNGRKAR